MNRHISQINLFDVPDLLVVGTIVKNVYCCKNTSHGQMKWKSYGIKEISNIQKYYHTPTNNILSVLLALKAEHQQCNDFDIKVVRAKKVKRYGAKPSTCNFIIPCKMSVHSCSHCILIVLVHSFYITFDTLLAFHG